MHHNRKCLPNTGCLIFYIFMKYYILNLHHKKKMAAKGRGLKWQNWKKYKKMNKRQVSAAYRFVVFRCCIKLYCKIKLRYAKWHSPHPFPSQTVHTAMKPNVSIKKHPQFIIRIFINISILTIILIKTN